MTRANDISSFTRASIPLTFSCGHMRFVDQRMLPSERQRTNMVSWAATLPCVDCIVAGSWGVHEKKGGGYVATKYGD
jgi:hypothetical protein